MRATDARGSKGEKGKTVSGGGNRGQRAENARKLPQFFSVRGEFQRKYKGKVTLILDITNVMSDVHAVRLIKGLMSWIFHLYQQDSCKH